MDEEVREVWKDIEEKVMNDCRELVNVYSVDEHVFDILREVIEIWLENGDGRVEELYENMAVIVGENAARLVNAMLASPMQLSIKLIEICENIEAMDGVVLELRKLVALFNAKIMKKIYSNRVRNLRVEPVNTPPPKALRIEATKVSGERIILELDRDDVEKIMEAAREHGILDEHSGKDNDDIDQDETELGSQLVAKQQARCKNCIAGEPDLKINLFM